ncbi:MAG: hypothetical protein KJ882_08350 [Proteobacteria bacterium]|nr:hypothetical protein [Pseudomonadota bacterium]MBU4010763.1 hypothetical protein [Pseudomonadota bacterium]
MKHQKDATSNVKIVDEMSHVHELPKEHLAEHFQDHIGAMVLGKAGDNDIFVCSTIYHVGGRLWGIKDGALVQTNLIIAPSDQRKMQNNDFVGNRLDPMKSFSNFQIVQESDKGVWIAGNRRMVCCPPYWEMKGEHMGVDLDLTMGGIGESIPYHGPWSDLSAKGVAGNEHLGWAEGSLTFKGKKYIFDEGWAVRERTCFGKGFDVPSLLGHSTGYIWGWCFSESIKIFCFAEPEANHFSGRVFLEDQIINFGVGDITVEPLEFWKDTLTDVTIPIQWNIIMKAAGGTVEMNVAIWARALFGFHLTEGYTTHHAGLGRANGRFVFPDGHSVSIKECQAYFEQGKATPLGIG